MPELPEVETTRRGIAGPLEGRVITAVHVRQPKLRWPVPADLQVRLVGATLTAVQRRAKYLLLRLARGPEAGSDAGTVLIHLGMSGSLRLTEPDRPPGRHDPVDLVFAGDRCLRMTDPRRFGSVLWTGEDPAHHPLLAHLGPEPLEDGFDGGHLYRLSRGRRVPMKSFLMDGRVVVGVGNIYANEALHVAGIHPLRAAGRVAEARFDRLADAVKEVLSRALAAGGTTLRNFSGGDGRPGYFAQQLAVYGRAGQPCACGAPLRQCVVGQRSTFYCVRCQR